MLLLFPKKKWLRSLIIIEDELATSGILKGSLFIYFFLALASVLFFGTYKVMLFCFAFGYFMYRGVILAPCRIKAI